LGVDRSLQNTDYTFNGGVTVDEVGTDPSPDSATVTITRADGTPVVTAATAVNGPNGGFSYTLVPAQTALLDTLTATWTFTLNGFAAVTDQPGRDRRRLSLRPERVAADAAAQ
jgi:hypothetical protein